MQTATSTNAGGFSLVQELGSAVLVRRAHRGECRGDLRRGAGLGWVAAGPTGSFIGAPMGAAAGALLGRRVGSHFAQARERDSRTLSAAGVAGASGGAV